MKKPDLRLIDSGPLPYLLSLPSAGEPPSEAWPLLCFLHGYDEGPPTHVRPALTRHGPLAPRSASIATSEFIIVAMQMPRSGDVLGQSADAMQQIVRQVQAERRADPERTYLTGFSFGGNGVFDLALRQRDFWAALWPVDPTPVPRQDPARPVWFSSGEISRPGASAFIRRLQLKRLTEGESGERVYEDRGQDHVGTATLAYQDERIYRWLLSKHLASTIS